MRESKTRTLKPKKATNRNDEAESTQTESAAAVWHVSPFVAGYAFWAIGAKGSSKGK